MAGSEPAVRASHFRMVSLVLPAFNEEENLPVTLREASGYCQTLSTEWEIIVVDDGSLDHSVDEVMAAAARDPRIRLLRFREHRGYGAALRAGFGHAQGDLIFYTDSDRQFDIGELGRFVELAKSADIVVGYRLRRADSVLRRLSSWAYNRLAGFLFRINARDIDCAFKLFRREVFESIELHSENFFIDAEMLAKARRHGFRIVETGVRHFPRVAGASSVRPGHVIETLGGMAVMYVRLHAPRRGRPSPPTHPVCQPQATLAGVSGPDSRVPEAVGS